MRAENKNELGHAEHSDPLCLRCLKSGAEKVTSSLTHLEILGVPGSSSPLSSPVRPLQTDANEPKIEKKTAPHTKENGAKKSTLRLPNMIRKCGSRKVRRRWRRSSRGPTSRRNRRGWSDR